MCFIFKINKKTLSNKFNEKKLIGLINNIKDNFVRNNCAHYKCVDRIDLSTQV